MRIAFVTPEFATEPYFCGGLASYLHRVGKALAERGHEVVAVVRSEQRPRRLALDGIEVQRVPRGAVRRVVRLATARRLGETADHLDFAWGAYRLLRRLHAERPLDLVQSPNSRACGLAAQLALGVPHVVRISCYRPLWNELAGLPRGLDRRLCERLEWLALRLAHHVYSPSRAMQRLVAREAGVREIRVIRPPAYLETEERDPSVRDALRGAPFLLFFGRLQLHKGFGVLTEALPGFLERHPEARVVLAGQDLPSPLGPSMQAWARERCGRHAERLIFTGALRHAQLYPLVAAAHLVVLPSLAENLPNACLEAMALGAPVLGTLGTSFEELIRDGESGFLVRPGDPPALARKLDEAWTHPRRAAIGEAARRAVRALSPEGAVGELLDYYADALGRAPLGAAA